VKDHRLVDGDILKDFDLFAEKKNSFGKYLKIYVGETIYL